jgi:ADP-ribosylation factor-like protein 1
VLLQEGKSRISSPVPEASSPDYWRAVLIIIKHARLTYQEDKESFLAFLSQFKAYVSKSQAPPKVRETNSIPLTPNNKETPVSEPTVKEERLRTKSLPICTQDLKGGKISVLGLARAGKTSIIQRLKTGEFISNPAQTIGVNTETIQVNNSQFTAWDLGGEILFRRALWEMYTKNSTGLVYVIDLLDQQRFSEVQTSIKRVIKMPHLKNLPLALFFNKIDLLVNLPEQNLLPLLGISELDGRELKEFKTSAKTGEGIIEGITWLLQVIKAQN